MQSRAAAVVNSHTNMPPAASWTTGKLSRRLNPENESVFASCCCSRVRVMGDWAARRRRDLDHLCTNKLLYTILRSVSTTLPSGSADLPSGSAAPLVPRHSHRICRMSHRVSGSSSPAGGYRVWWAPIVARASQQPEDWPDSATTSSFVCHSQALTPLAAAATLVPLLSSMRASPCHHLFFQFHETAF